MLKPQTAHDCDLRPVPQWGVDRGGLRRSG